MSFDRRYKLICQASFISPTHQSVYSDADFVSSTRFVVIHGLYALVSVFSEKYSFVLIFVRVHFGAYSRLPPSIGVLISREKKKIALFLRCKTRILLALKTVDVLGHMRGHDVRETLGICRTHAYSQCIHPPRVTTWRCPR